MRFYFLILFSFCIAPMARAQFVAVSGGGLFPQSLSSATGATGLGGQFLNSASFTNCSVVAVDGGIGLGFPFLGIGVHYSYSRPELTLHRADALGSSAVADLHTHTVTFDARFNTPRWTGFRGYGFAGVGVSRFAVDVKSQVEIPFPSGVPSTLTAPVFDFGVGVEKKFFPLLAAKFEVRDYVTSISSQLYQPGGAWRRVAVLAGIVLGR